LPVPSRSPLLRISSLVSASASYSPEVMLCYRSHLKSCFAIADSVRR
jgi:hypothetical protein